MGSNRVPSEQKVRAAHSVGGAPISTRHARDFVPRRKQTAPPYASHEKVALLPPRYELDAVSYYWSALSLPPHIYRIAATFKISTAGAMLPDAGTRSATIAALDADIEILTAAQTGFKAPPIKVVFESVVSVLCLIRVRVSPLFPFLHSLLGDVFRTR